MENLEGKWCYGTDSEDFTGAYETKEEAIANGKEDIEENLTVGKMYIPKPDISAYRVIEHIQEEMYDYHGDAAERYLDNVTSEQEEELETELNKVLDVWIAKNNLQPDFYGVKDIEYVEE